MPRTKRLVAAVAVLALLGPACGDDADTGGEGGDAQGTGAPTERTFDLAATEYAFEAPESIESGVVQISLDNQGQEPHFAGLAKVNDGADYEAAVAALTAPPASGPPSGPPPFTEAAGVPTVDPGVRSNASFSVEPGTYAIFCLIPTADGQSHAAKGMVRRLEVTEGDGGELPTAQATVVGQDFSYADVPTELAAGEVTVGFRNSGQQLHEINLVQLNDGASVDDVAAFFGGPPSGPPPMRALGGVAVAPGSEGTADFSLEPGARYAFVCVIPDTRGDFAPHITKGMFSGEIAT